MLLILLIYGSLRSCFRFPDKGAERALRSLVARTLRAAGVVSMLHRLALHRHAVQSIYKATTGEVAQISLDHGTCYQERSFTRDGRV